MIIVTIVVYKATEGYRRDLREARIAEENVVRMRAILDQRIPNAQPTAEVVEDIRHILDTPIEDVVSDPKVEKNIEELIIEILSRGIIKTIDLVENIKKIRPQTTKQAVYHALRKLKKEEVVVTITKTGYVNRLPLETYKQQKRGGKGIRATGTKEGDFVKADQNIVQVETDKAVVEIPSPKKGTILKLNHKEGEVINVGEVISVIGEKGEKVSAKKESIVIDIALQNNIYTIEGSDSFLIAYSLMDYFNKRNKVIRNCCNRNK